ncbi:MAG: hypothetical protein AB1467_05995 [Candidatus Diapherotrites archaeon]
MVISIWSQIYFTDSIGWVWVSAAFLAAFVLTRMFVVIFAASIPSLEKKLPLVFILHFWALIIVMNLIL